MRMLKEKIVTTTTKIKLNENDVAEILANYISKETGLSVGYEDIEFYTTTRGLFEGAHVEIVDEEESEE